MVWFPPDARQRVRRGQAALALLCPLLAGCEIPNQVNPVWIYREVAGINDAGRPPPPGLDAVRPNLASVPPRPERPTFAAREAMTEALAADRAASRAPRAPLSDARPAAAAAPGEPPIPAGPPPPPRLAAAAAVPWSTPLAPRSQGRRPEPPAPELEAAPPAPPPPELLAPPPPPALR